MVSRIEFGQRLRAARARRRLSQTEVARALHTTKQTISHWEHGVSWVNMEDLQQLAVLYGQSISDLFDDAPDPSTDVRRGDDPMDPAGIDEEVSWQQLALALARAMEARERTEMQRAEIEAQKIEVDRLKVTEVDAPRARADERAQENLHAILDKAGIFPHRARPADEAGAAAVD